MRKTYPEFIENAHRDNFTNFANIGKDRWDTFEIDGYRKLSNVLKKSKETSWERLYVYYTDLYIMIQFLANYDEKYELVENLNKETLTKLMEDNLDNPYINWDMIYYHFEDKYKYKYTFGYLDRWDTIVLNVLFKFSRKLKQENEVIVMNKDILNFNKEIALEVRKIIKKTQNFTKELILKSAKEKGLCLEVLNEGECTQSYLVKNVEYVLELIENEKIKCTSKMGNKFGLAYKTYTFEDLLIIENLNKKDYYTVISKDEIINLNNYESDFESLQSFLDKFIKVEED